MLLVTYAWCTFEISTDFVHAESLLWNPTFLVLNLSFFGDGLTVYPPDTRFGPQRIPALVPFFGVRGIVVTNRRD